jgi:histidine ammonia-lyase
MSFAAWRNAVAVGRCLDAALAVLAVVASEALRGRDEAVPPTLAELLRQVREVVPRMDGVRRLGPDCENLARSFAGHVFVGRVARTGGWSA